MRFVQLGVIALSTLLFSGVFFTALAPQRLSDVKVPEEQQVTLRPGYYDTQEIDSFSNSTWIVYNVTSSSDISIALMTSAQMNAFQNSASDGISNSITYLNGTSSFQDVEVSAGQYFVVFYAYDSRAVVDYGYTVYPNTPFSYGTVQSPEPMGIASFGITNNSGVAVPYQIDTSQIVGVANISSILANNPQAPSYGDNVAGATLQLNTNLVVNESNGLQDIYWVQNTPDFVTSNDVVSLTDNIWNNTNLVGMLSNQTVMSTNFANGGAVYTTVSQGVTSYAYLFSENNVTYRLPFSFALIENATVEKGTGVLIQLGFHDIQNGSLTSSPTFWYDNVTIETPNAVAAYYEVDGNDTTPIGSFYDSEFVFAGEGNYESTSFIDMSASLGLFYNDQGVLTSFPSYYSFGGDTGEAVNNLVVSFSNGVAYVQSGNPNFAYLGTASTTLPSDFKLPPAFSAPQSTNGSTSQVSSQTTSATSPVVSSNNDFLYVAAAVVIVIVVVAVAIIAMRRSKAPLELQQSAFQTFPQAAVASPKPCPYCGTMLPTDAAFCSQCGQPQQA